MHTFTDINGKADVTWYERSGLIAHKGRLYYISPEHNTNTLQHAARVNSHVKVYDAEEYPTMKYYWYISLWFVDVGPNGPAGNAIDGLKCKNRYAQHIAIWERAQALIKSWASAQIAQRKARQLAFAMAWHWRLGGQSTVAAVPKDLVRGIIKQTEEPERHKRAHVRFRE